MARDHPRVCGEHVGHHEVPEADPGSSPRMRGTPLMDCASSFAYGIIPAYAGNTCRHARNPFSDRDHPRVCGEHSDETSLRFCEMGSSPRMRGTLSP